MDDCRPTEQSRKRVRLSQDGEKPMLEIAKVKEQFTSEFGVLEFEATTLDRAFHETRFFGHPSNFPHAHYGYLMACMGKIDLLSAYWRGEVTHRGQTARMISFMNRYLHPGKAEENRVAVQMFRHTLMHTGALRFLYDRTNDVKYTWRVHFGFSFPAHIQHYTITTEDAKYQDMLREIPVSTASSSTTIRALNLSIIHLVGDLKRALAAYLADLETDFVLQANYERATVSVLVQEFN
jgi:hypothetical protein